MFRFFRVLKKAASDFSEDDCMSTGAAIAYYAIFSLPPLLVLIVAIAGYFGIKPDKMQKLVQNQWGVSSSSESSSSSNQSQKEDEPKARDFGLVSRIVGGAILLFSATGLFSQLQYALNRAWEVKPDPKKGGIWAFITKRILSFGMVVVVAFLLLISFVLTTVIDELIAWLHGAPEESALAIGYILNNLAAFVVATLLFAAMFKVLPDAKMAWKDAFVGAAFTGLLFVIGKTLIGLYLQHSDLGSGWGDAAASMIGVLVWMYYSCLILLFGAELTQVWASEYGRGIQPAPGAVPANAAT
ncbi:MAG TPA: YihY/virulence factor BrkB family protein [Lacipirellulaceae bacterium]|nr:YihY/virulence factor BrkB family protein [Lacipirellulaceae bacterium]